MSAQHSLKERPCGSCGEGMLRPTNLRGTAMEHRDDPAVPIHTDFFLPVCNACGDMTMRPEQAEALDAVLEEAYVAKRREEQVALLDGLRSRGFTQCQVEEFAHVSPGYLSKLRKGKIASATTFRLLHLLNELPDQVVATVSKLDPRLAEMAKRPPRRSPPPRTGTDG